MNAVIQSICTRAGNGLVVDIECTLSNNLPCIIIVGFASKAVGEARERVRGAFAESQLDLPRKRITVNLAPADIPKADSGFDLAIAMSILVASGQVRVNQIRKQAYIAELGLNGAARPIRGIIGKLLLGRQHGMTDFYIAAGNLAQAQLVPGITLYPVYSLQQLFLHVTGVTPIEPVMTEGGIVTPPNLQPTSLLRLSDVVGQVQAKRALLIAAAGGHNLFFSGPPGTGKSMLAKALPSILPPLNHEEMLEVTHLHSLASHNYEATVTQRPFRAPHHSSSHTAITGGGSQLKPGEISLAHRGVLFFDELPEFNRLTVEALRQPLEDRVINLARSQDNAEYPANFILVATGNPCPCGYRGVDERCRCHPAQIRRYTQKLSGPILDRIDLFCSVEPVDHSRLLEADAGDADVAIAQQVERVRQLQSERFGVTSKLNADMDNSDIKRLARLEPAARQVLDTAASNMALSARAYMRCIRVARTIADLAGSPIIAAKHISDALAYRSH